jgi:contractile injection system tube protein
MALNVTKGGLSPATITNLLSNEVVKFMFNPYEYTISKQNTWQDKPVIGQNLPKVTFQQGGAETLSLTLHFDSQESGGDVRVFTEPLWKMMMIDAQSKNASSGKGEPPPVMFEWGKLHFKAIITNMSQKFLLFNENGVPLRCTVEVSLRQYLDDADIAPQTVGQTGTGATTTTATAVQGQRLDNIAAANGGGNPRQIAEANNIDNPLNVPPGTQLRVNK